MTCYPDIASLPAVPDVAIVLLGAERAPAAVHDLAARGCPAAIVLASGFTETGEEGASRQKRLLAAAGTMRILGPNTIGLVNLTDDIVLSATGALEIDHFPVGSIGVVSQSGGILGSLLSRAAARGIGCQTLISTSNRKAKLIWKLADFVDHLADDPATKAIALYDVKPSVIPAKFRAACLKAARAGKPVVAFKIGRSEAGARAAVSHTGAMSGADRMYDALFRQVGVIRAQTFADLLDMSAALVTGRKLRGNRVAVLTSTGGAGTLVSDDLGLAGFDPPFAKTLPPYIVSVDLATLWRESDALSLHCPLTDDNRQLINAATLARCKRGVILVNTARGGLVDESALLAAVQSGQVSMAALDSFAVEPFAAPHIFQGESRILLSPHIGGVTGDAYINMGLAAAKNCLAVLNPAVA